MGLRATWRCARDYFKYRRREQLLEAQIISKYHQNSLFRRLDRSLARAYLFTCPYKLDQRAQIAQGQSRPSPYGETPLTTLERLITIAQPRPDDRFVDLGCGRGRTVLFVRSHFQIASVGIDRNLPFILKADRIVRNEKLNNISFHYANFEESLPVHDGSLFYLFGSTLEDKQIRKLLAQIKQQATATTPSPNHTPPIRLITISYPAHEYEEGEPLFKLTATLPVHFIWGQTTAYLSELGSS